MPFSSQSVFYVLILNRTKGKVEGEIRSYLFSRFTIRDITEKKINHHRQYHTDQEKHLTAPSGFTLEYLKAFFHATENHWHPPGFPSGCRTSSSTNRGRRVWALPEKTEQRWTQLCHHTPPHCYTGREKSSSTGSILSVIPASWQASVFSASCKLLPGEEQAFLNSHLVPYEWAPSHIAPVVSALIQKW